MFHRLLENYQKLLMGLVDLLRLLADQLNPPLEGKRGAWAVWGSDLSQLSSLAPLSRAQNEDESYSDTPDLDTGGVLDVSLVHDMLEIEHIARVRFSNDGKHLAVATAGVSGHNKVFIHDVQTGALVKNLEALRRPTRESRFTDLCFSPDSLCLATGELDGTIRIWEILKNHVRCVLRSEGRLHSLGFSPNGHLLVSGSANGTVHIWNLRDGSSNILYCNLGNLRTVCFSTDGLYVAAGGLDGVWMYRRCPRMSHRKELDLGQSPQAFDEQRQWVHSLVFTPVGLMSSIYDKAVTHWDISVLEEYELIEAEDLTRLALDGMGQRKEIQIPTQTFKGYQNGPYSVAFVSISVPLRSGIHSVAISQDGRWVLSGSRNPSVCVWDAHNAEMHCELSRERKDDVVAVDFSPTGGHIATAYDDGGVRIWSYKEVHNTSGPRYRNAFRLEFESDLRSIDLPGVATFGKCINNAVIQIPPQQQRNGKSMAPRGLSVEEKRVKLLEIFQETKDFYQLKELEKLGPKMKGIVSQSVKEVLQSLVDDGLVQGEKIGASNFFWSFPSQQGVLIQSKVAVARESKKVHQNQIAELKSAIESEKAERHVSDTRSERLGILAQLKKELGSLDSELSAYGDSNPAKVDEANRAVFLAKEAVFRWTDNYSVLLGHFTRQNGVNAEDVRQYLGIGEAYEDLD